MNSNKGSEAEVTLNPEASKKLDEIAKEAKLTREQIMELVTKHLLPNMLTAMQLGIDPNCAAMRSLNDIATKGKLRRRESAKTEMRINVCASAYGLLCEASVIWGCSVQKALEAYVNAGDMLCEWSNSGFAIRGGI